MATHQYLLNTGENMDGRIILEDISFTVDMCIQFYCIWAETCIQLGYCKVNQTSSPSTRY